MATKQQKIVAAVAGALIVVVGGWAYAKHAAGNVARDQIEGFIVRQDLGREVRYGGIAASPFGSVTMSDLQIQIGPNSTVKIAALDISGLDIRDSRVYAVRLVAHDAEYPLLDAARDRVLPASPELNEMIGLGFSRLTGEVSVDIRYDDKQESLSFDTGGDIKDAGGWKARIVLNGIDPNLVTTLYSLPELQAKAGGLGLLAAAATGFNAAAKVTLSGAEITLDNSGISKRGRRIASDSYPSDAKSGTGRGSNLTEMALVRAGMAPSKAKSSVTSYQSWLRDGGKLAVKASLDRPLPLFRIGPFGIPTPVYDDSAAWLAAAKAEITN